MVRITLDLIRKRSEHNEGEIVTLEELSLHQEDIEKIEYLQNWCRGLRILLLQSNLVSKIENLNKMKNLEYLNLALNNIECIENLEKCESLEKLDLTLNFIGELTSVTSLRENIHLRTLYLTGNPCTEFTGYRDYVIAALPQLETLDSEPILRSDRIKASQRFVEISQLIIQQQNQYKVKRNIQRREHHKKTQGRIGPQKLDDPEEIRKYWDEMCDNSPETRVELANISRKQKEQQVTQGEEEGDGRSKRTVRLFKDDGCPLNVNEPRIPFTLAEDEEHNSLTLIVEVYRHLDTMLIEADVQPTYVRVVIKGKIFQVVLPETVHPDKSQAQRSQTTGHLIIKMPRVTEAASTKKMCKTHLSSQRNSTIPSCHNSKRELLEIGKEEVSMDFSRIVEMAPNHTEKKCLLGKRNTKLATEKPVPQDFEENPEVPPLE